MTRTYTEREMEIIVKGIQSDKIGFAFSTGYIKMAIGLGDFTMTKWANEILASQ